MRPLLILPILLASPVLAQNAPSRSAAEGAETRLNRQLEADRFRDEAVGARSPRPVPEGPPAVRGLEEDRQSLFPGLGRPEAEGFNLPGGERGALAGGENVQR